MLHYLFPNRCVLCDEKSDVKRGLCEDCHQSLVRLTNVCQHCATSLPDDLSICQACLKQKPYFDRVWIPYRYQGYMIQFVHQLKFSQQLIYADILGDLSADFLKSASEFSQPEYLIPVPLHAKRIKERGFNQALEIAKMMSKRLVIPLKKNAVYRTKHTQAQAQLAKEDRRKNIKNAFQINQDFHANHILLIDDVMTTGNTLNELAKIFKKSGVKHVDVFCCAKTVLN